jgi:D-aminopeptidase
MDEPPPPPGPPVDPAPSSAFSGAFLEPETGLLVRLEPAGARVRLHYGTVPELVDPDAAAEPGGGGARLTSAPDGLWLDRPAEHQRSRLLPLSGTPAGDIEGTYRCAELGSELTVAAAGGVFFGAFSGELGTGEMQRLIPVAGDVWRLPCPRALDYHAPGDWTVAFRRDAGRIVGARVGCWLARGLEYVST